MTAAHDGGLPPWLVVPVLRSCQSPTWIWLVNYLHYITLHERKPAAGISLSTMGHLVPNDAWTAERTSIFSISVGQDRHRTVSSTGENFLTLEHRLMNLLLHNVDAGNFTEVKQPGQVRKRWDGLKVVGSQYGEILPPWVDAETGYAVIHLRGAYTPP